MGEMVIVREIAEQVLRIPTLKGTPDRYLIDRANRVLRHCGSIAQLPEVRRFQIDNLCLKISALMRDSASSMYSASMS